MLMYIKNYQVGEIKAAKYSGIVAWLWKKVSHFDYDRYWRMREYVVSHRGG